MLCISFLFLYGENIDFLFAAFVFMVTFYIWGLSELTLEPGHLTQDTWVDPSLPFTACLTLSRFPNLSIPL